jgi:hypothetical protein
MPIEKSRTRSLPFGLAAIFLAALCAFFVFYTARLLYVTNGLRAIRPGGQGAYIGAVVFPLLALVFGGLAWVCIRRIRRG